MPSNFHRERLTAFLTNCPPLALVGMAPQFMEEKIPCHKKEKNQSHGEPNDCRRGDIVPVDQIVKHIKQHDPNQSPIDKPPGSQWILILFFAFDGLAFGRDVKT